MLTITGEVRKVLDDQYTTKDKRVVNQAILVIEPESGRQNYEVFLSAKQVNAGAKELWSKVIGRKASIAVSLFVNHDYRFYKYNAVGDAKPILEASKS